MKPVNALIFSCLLATSGCEQQQPKQPSVLERYGEIPIGSRIIVRLHADHPGERAGEQTSSLLKATRTGEFEGNLVSIDKDEIVLQPAFSRTPIHFGGSVVREIQILRPPQS